MFWFGEIRICTIHRTQAAINGFIGTLQQCCAPPPCPHIYLQLYMTALTGTYMPQNPFMETYQPHVYLACLLYIIYILWPVCTHMRGRKIITILPHAVVLIICWQMCSVHARTVGSRHPLFLLIVPGGGGGGGGSLRKFGIWAAPLGYLFF